MLTKFMFVIFQIAIELTVGFFGVMCVAAALFAHYCNKDITIEKHTPRDVMIGLFVFGIMCILMRVALGLYHRGLFLMG